MKIIDNTPIEDLSVDWGDPDGTGMKAKSLEQVQAFIKNKFLGLGYTYIGTATPSTTPMEITAEDKVFYIAVEKGDYTAFGQTGITELTILKSEEGRWVKEGLGIALDIDDKLTELESVANANNLDINGNFSLQTSVSPSTSFGVPLILKAGKPYDITMSGNGDFVCLLQDGSAQIVDFVFSSSRPTYTFTPNADVENLRVYCGSATTASEMEITIAVKAIEESISDLSDKIDGFTSVDSYLATASTNAVAESVLRIEIPMKIKQGDVVWYKMLCDDSIISDGIVNAFVNNTNIGVVSPNKDFYFTSTIDGESVGITRSAGAIVGSGEVRLQVGILRSDMLTKQEYENDRLFSKTSVVATKIGAIYQNRIKVNIKKGERFSIKVEGSAGLLSSNLIGSVYLSNSATSVTKMIDSVISSVCSFFEYVAPMDFDLIYLERGASGVVAVGDISFKLTWGQQLVNDAVKNIISRTTYAVVKNENLEIESDVDYKKKDKLYINLYGDKVISDGAYNLYLGSQHIVAFTGVANNIVLDEDITKIRITRDGSAITASGQLTLEVTRIMPYIKDEKLETQFISPNGLDSNDGTKESPRLTINSCLDNGARKIICDGGLYEQTINLTKSKYHDVKIVCGDANNRAIFKHPDAVLASSAELVDGYNKVKKSTVSFTYISNNRWIYQDGVADETTLISDDERHPSQRGLAYRCESTKIALCNSNSLDDALAEIESSSEYLWYYDANSASIYFSSPLNVSDSSRIMIPKGNFLTGNSESISFEAVGIDVRYMAFNLTKLRMARLTDCSAMYVWGAGAISWDNGIVELTRCEAARCIASSSTGDGFNAHADKTGDATAKTCCASLIDCWSHDNNDDGYSDHERAECVIRGGLFEYNRKAGVTPSYGSHCSCFNVMSRQNYSGFYYVGDVADDEGGVAGQLICYNCVAENNRRGGAGYGFGVIGTGNKAVFIQCLSHNNVVGYSASTVSSITLMDCKAADCDTIKYGNVNIHNSNLVQ